MLSNMSKREKAGLVICAVLGVVGIGAWVFQMTQGMQVTAITDVNIWGLTIAAFFAIIAAGAGLLILCGLSEFFDLLDQGKKQFAIALSFCAMMVGGLLVLFDLGNPAKFLYLIGSFNFTSFTVWDFWFLLLCLISAVVYFFLVRKGKSTKMIGVISLVLAVGIIVVEGVLLANNTSHPLWASSMSIVSFLAGAFLAGSALLAMIDTSHKRIFVAALVASALVLFAEVGTSLVAGTDMARATMGLVVAGPFSLYFYLQVIVGIVLPFLLVIKTKHVELAGLLSIVGLAAGKLWLLAAGESEIWTQFHHIGPDLPGQMFGYVPTLVEVGITVGGFAIGAFLFLLIKSALLKPEVK